ncbi:MAG: rhomboid family intramembrane serine protease [Candidatus Kapaibacterium sp.]
MIRRLYISAPLFSQSLLLLVLMGFVSNIVAHGVAFTWLSLPAESVFSTLQLWRLVLYPFASMSSASVALLATVLALFAPSLEKMMSTRRLALYVGVLVLAQGLVYATLLSQSSQHVVLSGGDSISFFLLGLFAFLMPRRVLRIGNVVEIRGLFLAFVLALTAFCVSALTAYKDPSAYIFTGALSGAIGVAYAVLVTTQLQLKLLRFRSYAMEVDSFIDQHVESPHLEVATTSIGRERTQQSMVAVQTEQVTEDDINRILDKIFEQGQESLTTAEREILEAYSQRLR